jgi:hypothetical protein
MYTRNQVAIQEYVSRFTAPLSASLQQDTQLLGPMGFAANNESAHDPYRPIGFEMNMHKPKIAIDMNEAIIRQRKFLEASSKMGRGNKHSVMNSGVFISANGDPMTEVEVAVDDDRATINAFHLHKARQRSLIHRDEALDPGGAQARVPGGGAGVAMVQRRGGRQGVAPLQYNIAPVNLQVAVPAAMAMMGGGGPVPAAGVGGAAAAAGGGGGGGGGVAWKGPQIRSTKAFYELVLKTPITTPNATADQKAQFRLWKQNPVQLVF